jgi:hypothetical protein
MSTPERIFLFDIDSVLVEPLGYRAALMATLKHFTRRLGLSENLLPDVDTIEYFEAMHITSEWDMAPIILSILFESLVQADPNIFLPSTISELKEVPLPRALGKIEYRKPVEIISENLVNGEYPAATALRISGDRVTKNGKSYPGLFPKISGSRILRELLSFSRDPYRSTTTRYFQHYSLGSLVYSQVYLMEPEFETASLLKTRDRALLDPGLRDEILMLKEQNALAMAAITNRPSSPPREITEAISGYAPEAEMALELNGLSQIPLIGFGRLRYAAERLGLETEALLKPSPVHIISAVLAAITDQEIESIYRAITLTDRASSIKTQKSLSKSLQESLNTTRELQIHVFEDTRWGIEAAFQAGRVLADTGIQNKIHAWGVAGNIQKVRTLERMGAVVYPDISTAVRAALT